MTNYSPKELKSISDVLMMNNPDVVKIKRNKHLTQGKNLIVMDASSIPTGLTKNPTLRVLLQTRYTHPCCSRKPSMAFEGL
jgi:hypothetical protein